MDQEVFLFFKIQLKKSTELGKNETRTIQLELMYQSGSAISQKVKLVQRPDMEERENSANTDEYKFLFLQVPFKLLLGTDVFMIIKVFTTTISKSHSEQEHIWTP